MSTCVVTEHYTRVGIDRDPVAVFGPRLLSALHSEMIMILLLAKMKPETVECIVCQALVIQAIWL